MRPRLRVERGGARRRPAASPSGGAPRWRRGGVPGDHLRLLAAGAAGAADPWVVAARRLLVSLEGSLALSLSALAPDDLPADRRGTHPFVALATYSALVLLALAAIVAVTALGRLVERLI
ncbi:MAG: hypothetical protein JO180_12265 [Gemmatirosa sp.]|nr:hypothetical protein [Gemmatirosa sp.]